MSGIAEALLAALSYGLAGRAQNVARASTGSIVILVVAGLLAVGASICLGAAAWYALRPELGALGAWLLIGVTLGVVATGLLVGRVVWLRQARAEPSPTQSPTFAGPGLLRGPELTLLLGALLAGFLAGRQPRR